MNWTLIALVGLGLMAVGLLFVVWPTIFGWINSKRWQYYERNPMMPPEFDEECHHVVARINKDGRSHAVLALLPRALWKDFPRFRFCRIPRFLETTSTSVFEKKAFSVPPVLVSNEEVEQFATVMTRLWNQVASIATWDEAFFERKPMLRLYIGDIEGAWDRSAIVETIINGVPHVVFGLNASYEWVYFPLRRSFDHKGIWVLDSWQEGGSSELRVFVGMESFVSLMSRSRQRIRFMSGWGWREIAWVLGEKE